MMDRQTLEAIKALLQEELQPIKIQLQENTQILKSLEHNFQENKALLDQLNHRTVLVEGTVKTINEKVDAISKDLNFVEVATGKNISDIAYLKSVK